MPVLPVVTLDISPAKDILKAFYYSAQKMPGLTKTAFNRTTQRFSKRFKARISIEPGPPNYPIQWTSLAQKIAVLIKLREEGNLPYERTHDLSTGWKILNNFKDYEGTLEAVNDVPYVVYVQGDEAQGFHSDRWVQINDVIAEESVIAEEMYIQMWFTVVDAEFG